jgi:hypothetical protein
MSSAFIREISLLHQEPVSRALELSTTDNASSSLQGSFSLLSAMSTPKLFAFAPLLFIVTELKVEWLSAQITELLYFLVIISWFLDFFDQLEVVRNLSNKYWVN